MKKPKRSTLRNKADRIFGSQVRGRGACEKCGSRQDLQCAHVISRRYLGVRWDPRNALCLCAKDHLYFTHHPLEFEVWVRGHIGDETYDELRRLALAQVGPPDYDKVLADLEGSAA